MKAYILKLFAAILLFSTTCSDTQDHIIRENPRDLDGETWNFPIVLAMEGTDVSVHDEIIVKAEGIPCEESGRSIEKYYWALDGQNLRDSTDQGSIKTSFPQEGEVRVLVKARDNEKFFSKPDTIVISVLRDPPIPFAGVDTSVTINTRVTLTGTFSQQFGSIVMYKWDFNGDGVYDDSSATSPSMSYTYKQSAPYKAEFYLRDDDGNDSMDSRMITVAQNTAPMNYLENDSQVVRRVLDVNGFTSVPVDTGICKYVGGRIWHLYLKRNLIRGQLTILPPEIQHLTELRTLRLDYNKLTDLPAEIGDLNNLDSLIITDNQLNSLPSSLGNLTKLKVLKAGHNELTSLPAGIGNLSHLTILKVDSNRLSSLPSSIGNLVNLTQLSITHNQLSSLPPSMGNMTQLEALLAFNNKLSSLPAEIGNLVKLKTLLVSWNKLTSLPAETGNLINLTGLGIGGNQLNSLPSAIQTLINLTYLNIGNNQISNLPASIGNLTQLGNLFAEENALTSLPVEIVNLNHLTYLDVSGNQLSSLPTGIINLPKLTYVNVNENQLCNLSQTVKTWISTNTYNRPDWESTQACIPLKVIAP